MTLEATGGVGNGALLQRGRFLRGEAVELGAIRRQRRSALRRVEQFRHRLELGGIGLGRIDLALPPLAEVGHQLLDGGPLGTARADHHPRGLYHVAL